MNPADLLDRAPAGPDQLAVRVVERAVEELLRSRPRTEGDELLALDAVARAAARLAAEHGPERRVQEPDGPVPMAGWWSFAAQLPEVALQLPARRTWSAIGV